MLTAGSASLLASLAGILISAIANALSGYFQRQQDAAAAEQRGAQRVTDAANKEAADAQARMSDANAAPRSRDLALGRLRDGTF